MNINQKIKDNKQNPKRQHLSFNNYILTISYELPELIYKEISKTENFDKKWIKKRLLEIADVNGEDKLKDLAIEALNTYRIYIKIIDAMNESSKTGSLPIKPKKIDFAGEKIMSDKIAKGLRKLAKEQFGIKIPEKTMHEFIQNEELEPMFNEHTLKGNAIFFTFLPALTPALNHK